MTQAMPRNPIRPASRALCLATAFLCLWCVPALSQSIIATPGTSGDQLLFVYDATQGRAPFLVVSNLASEPVTVEVAWYPQDVSSPLATQIVTLPGGGNSIFDPSQVEGVAGNAGITVVTPIRATNDATPVVPPSPGTGAGPLYGGFTLADLATGSGFGQNPLARLAVNADGRRAAAGSVVDGSTVRYQTFAPDGLVLPFYFNPTGEGLTNRVILAVFSNEYTDDGFRIGSSSATPSYDVLNSDGISRRQATLAPITGVYFDDVQRLAEPSQLRTSGKIVFSNLPGADEPNLNVLGLMTQALGTFSVGQRMPGAFDAPTERWTNNGDGTATDNTTGLVWELKTADGSIHDEITTYSWSTGTKPDGRAFLDFLGTLNAGVSDLSTTTGCFADECDWRLPISEELEEIAPDPECASPECATIPGETVSSLYWSSSTSVADPAFALLVSFADGGVVPRSKLVDYFVRAVRGGS